MFGTDSPVSSVRLGPEPWLNDPATIMILDAIEERGQAARFVGGCVRDALAKRPVSDIDIATPESPEDVVEMLETHGIRAIPTGIGHGTVTAVRDNRGFEITTLRRDVATDGRHARVAFTDDWIVDARRRDFTFNALSATRDGVVHDPFAGVSDLALGHVRFIGKPSDRIAEDYLRILRFFRFRATHGRKPDSQAALTACRRAATCLQQLPGERIRDEMLKLLAAPRPAEVLALMYDQRVLAEVLPEARDSGRVHAIERLERMAARVCAIAPDPLRRLAATLDPATGPEDTRAIAERWRLSNREARRLADMMQPFGLSPCSPGSEKRALIHKIGVEAFRDRALIKWANESHAASPLPPPSARSAAWIKTLAATSDWQSPVFPLNGTDLQARGVPAGPDMGRLLRAVEDWWAGDDFRASREACLAELDRQIDAP